MMVFFLSSKSIPGVELSAACQFIVVKEQGPEEILWEELPAITPPAPISTPAKTITTINGAIFQAGGSCAEDIAMVHN